MELTILANAGSKEELLLKGFPAATIIHWVSTPEEFSQFPGSDAFFDFSFDNTEERKAIFRSLGDKPVFVNSVTHTLQEIDHGAGLLFRFNGWPTFINKPLWELAAEDNHSTGIQSLFSSLGWGVKLVPDISGMIAPRVISSIINEAYFTLGDDVSSKEEIDIAMKLGTNYPYGPFEWAEKIGLKNIYNLLMKLSLEDSRYQPSTAMIKEIED